MDQAEIQECMTTEKAIMDLLCHKFCHLLIFSIILIVLLYMSYKIWVPFDYQQGLSGEENNSYYLFGKPEGIVKRDLSRLSINLRRSGNRLPPPYPNGWFGIIESSKLQAGECIAVFRSENGIVRALDAYCPHLGANMAIGGTVIGDCLQCPFHHWKFSGDSGKCLSIPDVETVPKVFVRSWHVCEVDGMVFVWYHAEGGLPRWTLPVINDGRYHYMARNDFLVTYHIQEIQENAADFAHINPVHGDNILAEKLFYAKDAWNRLGRHVWTVYWSHSEDCRHEAIGYMTHDFSIFNKISLGKQSITMKQIGPSYVQVFLKIGPIHVVIVHTTTPISPLVQRVIQRLYAPRYIKPFANMMWGVIKMLIRDVTLWNSKQYVSNPTLVRTDKFLKAYRTWYKQFYPETSESFEDGNKRNGRNNIMDW